MAIEKIDRPDDPRINGDAFYKARDWGVSVGVDDEGNTVKINDAGSLEFMASCPLFGSCINYRNFALALEPCLSCKHRTPGSHYVPNTVDPLDAARSAEHQTRMSKAVAKDVVPKLGSV